MTERQASAVALRRADRTGDAPAPATGPRWLRPVLRVPLTAKLTGANLLIAGLAVAALWVGSPSNATERWIVGAALAVGLALNVLLVRLALRPVWELERVAGRVWRGDLAARVGADRLADPGVARVGRTFNLLLASIADDRERLRTLALQTVRAQDDERSRIARELHDSTAQQIAALTWQLAAAARDAGDDALRERLLAMREAAGELLEDVRLLSHAIHPRVLDDLGLVPALEWLARRTREHAGLAVEVLDRLDEGSAPMSDVTAATLYRVAQESLRNVERHSGAARARLELRTDGSDVLLEVTDDGRGFDLDEAVQRRPGMGLFSMRERVGLVGGTLQVVTSPGQGTRVLARAPLAFVGPSGGNGRVVPFMPPVSELR